MNLFSKIFKKKISVQSTKLYKNTNDYIEGEESFKIGWKLFKDYIIDESLSPERRKQKNIAALEFFDCAIEYGYDKAEVFSFRGICLRNLNYDLDALEDFNKCIDKDPERASFYYNRAMTKQYIYDYH